MLTVVTGPPAAGKSTWIRAHARPTDIVIDYDVIAQSIAGPGASTHDHTKQARAIAHRMRFAAIDEAVRHMRETDVYLIHTQPNGKALARYRRLEARIVEVDPGRDVVMERIRSMRRPGLQAVATRWYKQRPASSSVTLRATSQGSRRW